MTIITSYKCFQNAMLEAYYSITLSEVNYLFGMEKEYFSEESTYSFKYLF